MVMVTVKLSVRVDLLSRLMIGRGLPVLARTLPIWPTFACAGLPERLNRSSAHFKPSTAGRRELKAPPTTLTCNHAHWRPVLEYSYDSSEWNVPRQQRQRYQLASVSCTRPRMRWWPVHMLRQARARESRSNRSRPCKHGQASTNHETRK